MPMIDVYSAAGTFADEYALAREFAAAVMRWELVPDLPLFKKNTAAFVHDLPASSISNVNGDSKMVVSSDRWSESPPCDDYRCRMACSPTSRTDKCHPRVLP